MHGNCCLILGNPVISYNVLVIGPERKHNQANNKNEDTFSFFFFNHRPKSFICKMKQNTNMVSDYTCRSKGQTMRKNSELVRGPEEY